LVRAYCVAQKLEWYWLRVFAVFGPKEDAHWFVSFVAANFLSHQSPALTKCEQQYDYLFAPDLARAIVQTLPAPLGHSGVYNIGANRAISLRTMVDTIRELIGTTVVVQYGALPYRPGQVMHMESNTSRFEHTFGAITQTALPKALAAAVEYVNNTNKDIILPEL
jgi:nucleoside-diphosphate-sugar epimerase